MLHIVGGVCLLLWGLRGVRNGMTRAFGEKLHRVVHKSTGNRIAAFGSGIGITALLQSSTATALIVAAFCGRGLMSTAAGLAVILGADVGTTLVAQILSFDLSWLVPVLIIGGYVMNSSFKHKGRYEHLGKLFIGLGLMLLALGLIKEAAEPLKDSQTLATVLVALEKDLIFAVLVAAVLTWLAHSSLAIVLLLTSLVASGVLPVTVGIAMVLGANLGGVMAPLMATLRDSPEATRVPVGNIIMRVSGVVIAFPFLGIAQDLLLQLDDNHTRLLVNFHTAFNVCLAMLFLPLTKVIADICVKIVPEKTETDDPMKPKYLDKKELDTPAIALASAMRETLRMADIVQSMLNDTILALQNNDERLVRSIRERDHVLDSLYKAVKMYMARITQESLDPEEANSYVQVISFTSNLENVGDTIDKSLMEMAQRKIRTRKMFSDEGWKDIQKIHRIVSETMRLAQSVFVSKDVALARKLVEDKDTMRLAEVKATEAHFERIREGIPETIATSSLHLDIIRDYRRINSYLATVGYPILEESGMLRSSRLRSARKAKKKQKEAAKEVKA